MTAPLTEQRVAELMRIAEATGGAAPGKWGTECDKHGTLDVTWSATTHDRPDHFGWVTEYVDPVFATHIAALDPPTVLALLAELKASREEVEGLRAVIRAWDKLAPHIRPPRVRSEAGLHNGRDDVRVIPTHRLKTFTDRLARLQGAQSKGEG